ncbi:hypothetical protein F4801DRAFT_241894 [Xylaria longipes]|nr:hypothetical protein F4801DRAFT_241894 [Xylaria longipes]RYC61331.1 hypothetical protein CHU98_g4876 [Xylaria longipes]
MAVVLSSEESDLFSSALRRSHSQSKFVSSRQSTGFHTSASTSRIDQLFRDNYRHQLIHPVPVSSPSSGPPSPTIPHVESESNLSYTSTPATSVSFDGQYESDSSVEPQDSLLLSEYGDNPYFMLDDLGDIEPSLISQLDDDTYTASPTDDTSAGTSRPGSPGVPEHAEDDTAVKHRPTHHVDYLSHNWREEDIWSSWRYIISKRGDFANAPRLENASWRTWMKAKYRLKTVSPETLNWLKDCDVTWLYGPLQTGQCTMFPNSAEQSSSTLSRTDSFVHKKPILKKRSMSEVMLQRSISSSSLLKQAAAAVQAQQKGATTKIGRPILHRAHTDVVTFPFSKRRRSRANTSLLPSTATSGLVSPATERKHIHFDEQVKQCIAVEVKGDEDDEDDEPNSCRWRCDDSDSDDGAIMMKTTRTGKKPIYLRKKTPINNNNESKTIAMLPSTTLKYREDSPAPPDSAIKHSTGIVKSPTISPSPSQETLRPSKPSGAFFQHDSEDDMGGPFRGNEPSRNSSLPEEIPRQSGLRRSTAIGDLREEGQPAGMRRTESGMFMPYEEGEPQPNDGIIGRVIDTVNTARDIAHVIWNVGWRK